MPSIYNDDDDDQDDDADHDFFFEKLGGLTDAQNVSGLIDVCFSANRGRSSGRLDEVVFVC